MPWCLGQDLPNFDCADLVSLPCLQTWFSGFCAENEIALLHAHEIISLRLLARMKQAKFSRPAALITAM